MARSKIHASWKTANANAHSSGSCTTTEPRDQPAKASAVIARLRMSKAVTTSFPEHLKHIKRPRNAFILFRTAMVHGKVIPPEVENNHLNISRIISHMWHKLSESDKGPWRERAEEEKIAHAIAYPEWKYRNKKVSHSKHRVAIRRVEKDTELKKKRTKLIADSLLRDISEDPDHPSASYQEPAILAKITADRLENELDRLPRARTLSVGTAEEEDDEAAPLEGMKNGIVWLPPATIGGPGDSEEPWFATPDKQGTRRERQSAVDVSVQRLQRQDTSYSLAKRRNARPLAPIRTSEGDSMLLSPMRLSRFVHKCDSPPGQRTGRASISTALFLSPLSSNRDTTATSEELDPADGLRRLSLCETRTMPSAADSELAESHHTMKRSMTSTQDRFGISLPLMSKLEKYSAMVGPAPSPAFETHPFTSSSPKQLISGTGRNGQNMEAAFGGDVKMRRAASINGSIISPVSGSFQELRKDPTSRPFRGSQPMLRSTGAGSPPTSGLLSPMDPRLYSQLSPLGRPQSLYRSFSEPHGQPTEEAAYLPRGLIHSSIFGAYVRMHVDWQHFGEEDTGAEKHLSVPDTVGDVDIQAYEEGLQAFLHDDLEQVEGHQQTHGHQQTQRE